MTYIGIEGSSYVGKTTTVNRLREKGYATIPEYDQFGPFPEFDNSFNGLCRVIENLIDRERHRTELLGSSAIRGDVFSDRTPISFLSFEDMKAIAAKTLKQRSIHIDVSDYAKGRLTSEVQKGNIILPQGIVVLQVSTKANFEERVRLRGVTSVHELAIFELQEYIANRTKTYASELIGHSNSVSLTVDGVNIEELSESVITFAKKISEKNRRTQ